MQIGSKSISVRDSTEKQSSAEAEEEAETKQGRMVNGSRKRFEQKCVGPACIDHNKHLLRDRCHE